MTTAALAWIALVASGAFEAMWAVALASGGMPLAKRIGLFVVGTAISMVGLGYALTVIDVGTGYAVWVGVGAIVTLAYSIIRGEERLSAVRALCVVLLLGGVIGLKVVG